jgi:hypothetical protein
MKMQAFRESMGGGWAAYGIAIRPEMRSLPAATVQILGPARFRTTAKTLVATRSLGKETQVFPLGPHGTLTSIIVYSALNAGGI